MRSMRRVALAAVLGFALAAGASAAPLVLAPFKDDLFSYPPLTAVSEDGAFTDVAYSEARDIDERDTVPERRVRSEYVELAAGTAGTEREVATPAGPLKVMTVGEAGHPTAIVLFIHGRGGDRTLGMRDWTFGGNFNRLKNLMLRADGLYVTADAGSFSKDDRERIERLIGTMRATHEGVPFVLACASMGGEFCWSILARSKAVDAIDGLVFLSTNNRQDYFKDVLRGEGGRKVPIVLAHGTKDQVFAWDRQKSFFEEARKAHPNCPIRFLSFEGGTHGTPLRMIDWRRALNWIFAEIGPRTK